MARQKNNLAIRKIVFCFSAAKNRKTAKYGFFILQPHDCGEDNDGFYCNVTERPLTKTPGSL